MATSKCPSNSSGRYDCLWTCELESGGGMSQESKGTFVCLILTSAPAVIGSWWNGTSPTRNLRSFLTDFSALSNCPPIESCKLSEISTAYVGPHSSPDQLLKGVLGWPLFIWFYPTARLFFQECESASALPLLHGALHVLKPLCSSLLCSR